MSSVNFAALSSRYPEFGGLLAGIQHWIDEHQQVRILEPRRVARDAELPKEDVFRVFFLLNRDGLIRQAYRVKDPGGDLLPHNYKTLQEIPMELRNRRDEKFNVDDGEIVSVYMKD
jgi:hypothetical protein